MSWAQWVAALMLDLGVSDVPAAFLGVLAVWVWQGLAVTLVLGGLEAWAARLRAKASQRDQKQPAQRKGMVTRVKSVRV